MADVKWIKIVVDIFDDEKLLLIDSYPEADAIIVIWFKLLCLAGKQNNGGVFIINDRIAYTDEMLAVIFRRPINTIRLALKVFEEYGMIEIIDNVIRIPNWDKHQSLEKYEKEKENRAERNRRYYEKKKQERIEADEIKTSYKTDSDDDLRRLKTPLEEIRKEEEEIKDISPSSEVEPPPEKASASVLTKTQQSRFDAFWRSYPKKVGKQDAQKAWKKIAPDEELTDTIIRAVETAKQKDSRFREERFIPHPATWLNAGSWENEYDDYFPAQEQPKQAERHAQAPKPQSEDSLRQLDVDGFLAAATRRRRT